MQHLLNGYFDIIKVNTTKTKVFNIAFESYAFNKKSHRWDHATLHFYIGGKVAIWSLCHSQLILAKKRFWVPNYTLIRSILFYREEPEEKKICFKQDYLCHQVDRRLSVLSFKGQTHHKVEHSSTYRRLYEECFLQVHASVNLNLHDKNKMWLTSMVAVGRAIVFETRSSPFKYSHELILKS